MASSGSDKSPSQSVCDSSVPKARAKAFDRWSAKCTKHPEPARLRDFFEIRCNGSLGTHAVATRAFQNGDVILAEAALIRIPEASQSSRQKLFKRYGQRAAFLFPGVAVDWTKIERDVKEAVLALFWAHPSFKVSSEPVLSECRDLLANDVEMSRFWSAQELMQYLHIVDLNIHKDDEDSSFAPFSGLFVLGSKFSHSCAPNCTWSFSREGLLQYHAVRKIKPGDALTFSYIGNGMNMVTGTLSRRRRLASLWFVCLCSRCQQPDLSRQLRCPKCAAPKCIPADKKSKELEWSAEKPVHLMIPDVKVWKCGACNSTFKPEQMPLDHEDKLSDDVPAVMQGHPQNVEEDADRALELRRAAASKVGQGHWTWMLATFAYMQKCHIIASQCPVVEFSERDVQAASSSVARWFEEFAPNNTEQRMSALSITIRLMEGLGGSLEDWGYNEENPLGDDLPMSSLAKRLGMSKAKRAQVESEEHSSCGEPPARSATGVRGSRAYCGRWQ